jgi:hypothetical protein
MYKTQSYDLVLQRQRCKKLQRHEYLVRFENKTILFYFEKTL